MLNVFLGYSRSAPVASSVAAHSLITHASQPIAVTHLHLGQLKDVYSRPRHELQSTDFSFSRFLVPHLMDYRGWALFMDDDMLVQDDIAKLFACANPAYAVQVVKHRHDPPEGIKFLGKVQTQYEKKNWSSVMLFNCARCTALTPRYVNTATGLELHQFKWLGDDTLIGDLPPEWNHLVGWDSPLLSPPPSILHYTEGGPFYNEFAQGPNSREWHDARAAMLHCEQRTPA